MSSMEKNKLKINKRSFITVCVILVSFMVLAYALTSSLEKANTSWSERICLPGTPGQGLFVSVFITAPFRLRPPQTGLVSSSSRFHADSGRLLQHHARNGGITDHRLFDQKVPE